MKNPVYEAVYSPLQDDSNEFQETENLFEDFIIQESDGIVKLINYSIQNRI